MFIKCDNNISDNIVHSNTLDVSEDMSWYNSNLLIASVVCFVILIVCFVYFLFTREEIESQNGLSVFHGIKIKDGQVYLRYQWKAGEVKEVVFTFQFNGQYCTKNHHANHNECNLVSIGRCLSWNPIILFDHEKEFKIMRDMLYSVLYNKNNYSSGYVWIKAYEIISQQNADTDGYFRSLESLNDKDRKIVIDCINMMIFFWRFNYCTAYSRKKNHPNMFVVDSNVKKAKYFVYS